ncbi:MAG: hypothetical protein RTV41_08100 [Candidatus Thorarchaeota archaeon]
MAIESETEQVTRKDSRAAFVVWGGGLIFAILFTLLIWVAGPLLDPVLGTLLPDAGAEWYYWKLPAREFMTMFIVWTFYLAHQFSLWGAIYWAKKNLSHLRANPTTGLTRYNWAAIIINLFFIVLHLVQTLIWFDGLAQDVPIWTSQGSVIVMLALILVIENPSRGLFLGRKMGKPMTARVSGFFRRNHAYIISWAIVYTFWFHPMAYDPQLLTGFFYMFLLFTQISLAYTVVHSNKGWIVFLESFVGIHAFVVATTTLSQAATGVWVMFSTGFAFLFVFTYMFAFKVRREIKWGVILGYFAALVWIYLPSQFGGYGRDLANLMRMEFLWIPITLYLLAIVFSAMVFVYLRIKQSSAQE